MSRTFLGLSAAAIGVLAFFTQTPSQAAERIVKAPAPLLSDRATSHRETAIFAGGCFWGVEGVFAHVRGVVGATSGYTGGSAQTAQYAMVSTGATGHAEAVRVVFDPTEVSYSDLLRIYFSVVADPTQLNYQGPDHGSQYRSALFPQSPAQTKVARGYIAQLTRAHIYPTTIVTRIEGTRGFFPAEADHQDFMAKNPNYPYIVINDRPKVDALKRLFPDAYRA